MSNDSGTRIVTSGLVYAFDAGNTKSYPGTGTTLSDLSGNNITGTMTSVTYNTPPSINGRPNSEYFSGFSSGYVTGSNSYGPIPTGSNNRTIIIGVRTPSSFTGTYMHMIHYGSAATDQAFGLVLYNNGNYCLGVHTWTGCMFSSDIALTPSTFYIFAVTYNNTASPRATFYINGVAYTTSYGQGKSADYSVNTGTAFQVYLGTRISAPAEQFNDGRIYFGYVYNRALSAAEILQTYNALIPRIKVENNLIVSLDAANSSSYPGTGTTWFDLSGYGNNASLTVAPTWNSSGWFTFNGSTQYGTITKLIFDDFTIVVWFRTIKAYLGGPGGWPGQDGLVGADQPGGSNDYGLGITTGNVSFGTGSTDVTINSPNRYNDGLWHHAVATRTKSTGTINLYVDGVLVGTASTGNTNSLTLPGTLNIGLVGGYFQGSISTVKLYNKVLSTTEISLDYYNTQSRYFTNGSINNNNLVTYVDAANNSSYSGTGTTWFDISGTGNNVTLTVSPTWNSNGWFTFNGSTQYGTINKNIADDFTIIVWFRTSKSYAGSPSGWPGQDGLVGADYPGGNNDYGLGIYAGYANFGTGTNDVTTSSTIKYNDGLWHHAVATRTKSTGVINLYVDNVLVGTASTGNTNTLGAPSTLNIGLVGGYFQGDIAIVKFYNTVLSTYDISADWTDNRGRFGA